MFCALRLLAAGLGCAVVVAAAGPAGGQEADAGHEQTVDLTFPTDPQATYVDSYHDPRSGGRVHRATDLMGDKGWEVYAAVGGSVCGIAGVDGDEPAYGYALVVCGDDGRDYHYLHLNNDTPGSDDGLGGPEHAYAPGVSDGARVERGQRIAWMGDSGNAEASGPHLHFMIEDPAITDPYGSNYLNPYPSLLDAEARNDYVTGGGDTEVVAASQGGQPETVTAAAVDRVAGPDRVGTAVALSRAGFQTARRVVLASAESFPDAVAAGPLAAAVDGPLLTTWRERLDGRVAQEIRRLGATRVTLVGGRLALSQQVESDLVATTGVDADDIQRGAGADAPATAAA
ncbi:MAG TPA: cell wall-binding repeat-containing protein, partial [Egibacteraceae bacterium]|nr:cell wall-binding repeat-containing protein [Egibacteraceae bacterium]